MPPVMSTPLLLYLATIAGAAALLLMMPGRQSSWPRIGGLLGAAVLGLLWLCLALWGSPGVVGAGGEGWWLATGVTEQIYYYLFSLIAIGAAVRVITHTRPVYSALWFVLVVLAVAGLFLTLAAEFVAFAMVIIYGGAILVTYMFVIMLATHSDDPDFKGSDAAGYDRVARDPLAAIAAGFLLLAVLLTVAFEPMEPTPEARMATDAVLMETVLANRPEPWVAQPLDPVEMDPVGEVEPVAPPAAVVRVANVERVGLDLFTSHPLGLELAGIVLLVALIGAVVIARTRVDNEDQSTAQPDDATGATVRPDHEPGPHEPEAIGDIGGRLGP